MAGEVVEQTATTEASQEPNLKYLGFLHAALIKATVLVVKLYEFAKENSGPLKPGVDSVEGTVKTVVGPVLHKLDGKPAELLVLIDAKVDDAVTALQKYLPQPIKEKSEQALSIAMEAPEAARSIISEMQKRGIYETARSYYNKYEPVAEELSYNAWIKALQLPLVPQVVHTAAPVAIFGANKFNQLVSALQQNRIPLADYVPMLPVEKIERAVYMDESTCVKKQS